MAWSALQWSSCGAALLQCYRSYKLPHVTSLLFLSPTTNIWPSQVAQALVINTIMLAYIYCHWQLLWVCMARFS